MYVPNDIICGKTLTHQYLKLANDIHGEVPPESDDIKTETDKFMVFVDSLFVNKTGILHNNDFNTILYSTIMWHRRPFFEIIKSKNSGKYKNLTHCPFNKYVL